MEFMQQGESFFRSEQHERITRLLVTYGPEFPEEITPETYLKMAHALRREIFGDK